MLLLNSYVKFRIDRGQFQQICNISKTTSDEKWSRVTYNVFDLPSLPEPYVDRLNKMKELSLTFPKHVKIIESTKCKGN